MNVGRSVIKNRIKYYYPELEEKIKANGMHKQQQYFLKSNPVYNIELKKKILEKIRNPYNRLKSRLRMIDYVKNVCGGIRPNLGKNEKRILDKLELLLSYRIIRQYYVESLGYFVDGYIPELNLVIEIDEKYHQNKYYIKRDKRRESEIKNKLNCTFVRIKDNGTSPLKVQGVVIK